MADCCGSDSVTYRPSAFKRLRWKLSGLRYLLVKNWRSFCDWLKWIGYEPCNLETYAEKELRLAGWFDNDSLYGDMMGKAVMKMVREFSVEGHSGMSGSVALSVFKQVSSFKPLTPLTGDDDEWNEIGDGRYQNKRCGRVFKDEDGAYDSEGRIFREPNGACFGRRESRVRISFPYSPTTEIVDVDSDGNPLVTEPDGPEVANPVRLSAAQKRTLMTILATGEIGLSSTNKTISSALKKTFDALERRALISCVSTHIDGDESPCKWILTDKGRELASANPQWKNA